LAYNTAIYHRKVEEQAPEVVARTLQSLIRENLVSEARQVYIDYARRRPDNPGIAMLYADVLINAGELAEAERVLEGELKKNTGYYPLLFRVARLDEERGQNLNAFDLYRQAEAQAETAEQKREVRAALARVKKNIHSEVFFRTNSYTIKLEGNPAPLNLQYNLGQLIKRKHLLDAILGNLDERAKSVLEIECDAGIISRNLAAHGFKVQGQAAEMSDLLLAMGFDYVEMVRSAEFPTPDYYCLDIDETTLDHLEKMDVIMVLPPRPAWYKKRGASRSAKLLKMLFNKTKRQLFFYIPPDPKKTGGQALERKILAALNGDRGISAAPVPCFADDQEGQLYRIDQKQAVSGGIAKNLPAGLMVQSSRSSIFEIALEYCRSLNGFGYGSGGWNHFTAVLEEMLNSPGFRYSGSVLERFYEYYQPANRKEQLFGAENASLAPLNRGWTILPWVKTKNRLVNPAESPVLRLGGNPHYGPNSKQFGEQECKKLMTSYTLIKKFGYLPEIYPDGYIQGYFLKDGPDYRFQVNEGQHRMAVLGLLGYKTVKAKFNPEFMPVVDLKNIAQWPQVKSGLYTKELAEKVFRYYFEEDGRRKAKDLGLF